MFMFYSFWCCVLNNILIMGLLHMLLNTLVNLLLMVGLSWVIMV